MRSGPSDSHAQQQVPVLVGIDAHGRAEAWVSTRPGCVVFAESEAAAISGIFTAIYDFDEWLTRHGLEGSLPVGLRLSSQTSENGPECVHVVERVTVGEDLVQGNTAAFFDWDREPVDPVDIETTLQWLTCSRHDLLQLVHRLPSEAWSWRPGNGNRTVTDVLRHVGNVEWWYMSRIVDFPVPNDGYPEDVLPFLAWTRHRVAVRLRNLTGAERARIALPDRHSGELWSARKVLRRLVYHERYHIAQLRTLTTAHPHAPGTLTPGTDGATGRAADGTDI